MESLKLIAAAGLLLPAAVIAQSVSGVVFEDRNGNGTRDGGEPGIPNVMVTNEVTVALTNADGEYEIPLGGRDVISVIKPAGYSVPAPEMLPRFYFAHRPEGGPDYDYSTMEPTGDLPESVNFGLTAAQEPDAFRVVLFADPQPRDGRELDYVRREVLSELATTDAAFGMVLGDIMFDNLDLFVPWSEALAYMRFPFYHVVGNHDINFDAPDDSTSSETFIKHFGPENYAFGFGGAFFVAMDNIIWEGNRYSTGFDQRQADWLAAVLENVERDRLVVLGTHAPLINSRMDMNDNLDLILSVLEDRERVLAVNGHTHMVFHHTFTEEEGWRGEGVLHQHNIVTVSGSWWSGPTGEDYIPVATQRDGTPNGYVFLEIDGGDFRSVYKAAGKDANHQMRIYLPGRTYGGEDRILVNIFDGMPDAEVEVRINDGEWQEMEYAPQQDPIAMQYYNGPSEAGNTWVGAVGSTHMWELEADVPNNQTHRVEVRYSDKMGREFNQAEIILHR